jgi:phosphoserine phosphatase
MRGEIGFEPAQRERAARGCAGGPIGEVVATRIRPTPGATTLVHTLASVFYLSCLRWVRVFSHRVAARLGFDEQRANRLVIQDDHLAGEVESPILRAAAKRDALNDLRARFELEAADTLALGAAAGLGVAYHAQPSRR